MRFITLTDDKQRKESAKLDSKLYTVIDQLNSRALKTSAEEAEKLIGCFIAANQDVVTDIAVIKKELESVEKVTKILGYIDKLIEIAAAIAKSA